MQTTRRKLLAAAAAGLAAAPAQPSIVKYVRFRKGATTAYGILEGDTIREIRGDLFGDRKPAGAKHKLSEVKLLYPCTPPTSPEMFYKPITCLQNPDEPIVIPKD